MNDDATDPRSKRRTFLRTVAASTGISLAGCSGLSGSSNTAEQTPRTNESSGTTERPTPTRRLTRTATTATATAIDTVDQSTQSPAETTTPEPAKIANENLRYLSPAITEKEYEKIVYNRKEAALEVVLGNSEAGKLVNEAVSSTAYHRILEGIDFIEILAPHEMTVTSEGLAPDENSSDPFAIAAEYTIEYTDVKRIQALVDRDTDTLLKLDIGTREPHSIRQPTENKDLEPARISLQNERVRQVLADKNWYLAAAGVSPYAAYSEEYPIGSLSIVWFNWNDREGDIIALHTVVDQEAGEVRTISPPTRPTPQPLTDIVSRVKGANNEPKFGRGPIEPPGAMFQPELTQTGSVEGSNWSARVADIDGDGTVEEWWEATGNVEAHDWSVTWRNTVHEGYTIKADYKGKPVFGPQTKIPYMFSDYEPFGMKAPGVPKGKRITYQFWDPLGITGPGVLEKHDFEDGFRLRGTFHSGSVDRWEWRFGQNFGPYRYIVDWHFFADGTSMLISRHPTTGYRTTNGYPLYKMHLGVEPGFEQGSISAYDGRSWTPVEREQRFDRGETSRLRVENENGPERITFTRPGGVMYPLQYDSELIEYPLNGSGLSEQMSNQQYLDPENYIKERSLAGQKLYLRMITKKDTGDTNTGPHATVRPFAFSWKMKAENY